MVYLSITIIYVCVSIFKALKPLFLTRLNLYPRPRNSFHPCSTGYFCKCPASFMGSHCEVVLSPCASNPCLYGGTCVPRADDFYCQCRGQYSGQRYCFHTTARLSPCSLSCYSSLTSRSILH